MLSRTADSLFWLARYMERAEHVARLVLVGQRMAGLATSGGGQAREWRATLVAAGCAEGFFAKHATAAAGPVIDYLVRDPDNPSSIIASLETARRNARAVRTALTADMWDALNETWLRARAVEPDAFTPGQIPRFLEWVKERSLLFSGAYVNTMLRGDAYYFTRLGTFLERAEDTARILDVRHEVFLPAGQQDEPTEAYEQWQAILRSVSALRGYHWVYRARLEPTLIAELLILRAEMPRSLRNAFEQITRFLDLLAEASGGQRGECHRLAGEMHARLRYGRVADILEGGLHPFLVGFIDRVGRVTTEISEMYFR